MKKKTRYKKQTYYQCDSCNSEWLHNTGNIFTTCHVCNKEICYQCEETTSSQEPRYCEQCYRDMRLQITRDLYRTWPQWKKDLYQANYACKVKEIRRDENEEST